MDTNQVTTNKAFRIISLIFLAIAALFLLVKTINAFNGEGVSTDAKPQITVSGQGEYASKPDIAIMSYSVMEEGKTPKEAQEKATKIWNEALDYLKKAGVAEKDIKTTGYYLNPKYEYETRVCIKAPCPSGNPVLTGYTLTQTAEVKIRNLDKAGEILSGIGAIGVQNVNGLTFTFDDPDQNMAEARKQAIADAKEKAKILANDLGVRLVRISRFEESGSPIYYSRAELGAKGVATDMAAPAPQLPTGENKVVSNVTITYEIR